MKNRSMRTFLAGLLSTGLAIGWIALEGGQADAQGQILNRAAGQVLPQAGSTFFANMSWQPIESPRAWGPQQDQSMPPYRQPPPPKQQQPAPSNSYSAPTRGSNASDEAFPPFVVVPTSELASNLGSTYIPLDSWIYPALMRLYSLGYLDRAFVDMRPWTRLRRQSRGRGTRNLRAAAATG